MTIALLELKVNLFISQFCFCFKAEVKVMVQAWSAGPRSSIEGSFFNSFECLKRNLSVKKSRFNVFLLFSVRSFGTLPYVQPLCRVTELNSLESSCARPADGARCSQLQTTTVAATNKDRTR